MHVTSTLVARLAGGACAAALIATALTGCASGSGASSCTPQASSGLQSQSVTARGAFDTTPTVTFPLPTHVDSTQVSTLIRGSGAPITAAQEIVADITILDGTTGEVVTKTAYTGQSSAASFVVGLVPIKGIARALVCAQVGSRVAMVLSPKDGYSASIRPTTVAATDSLVVVADIRTAYLARADGVDQVMGSGLPAVVLAPNGRPGISIPSSAPPTKLTVANLEDGSGALLKKGDTAIVHYTGVFWGATASDDTVFDSSWKTGQPVALPLKSGSVVKGLVTALIGQRVGSQVLAVLPPDEAYGKAGSSTIPANSTLVFVVDILGKQ